MNSTQLRKSVWSRLLRGLSRPPRAKGRARLAVEALEDRWMPAQLSFVTQPLPTALGDFLNPKDGVQVQSPDGGPVTIALGNNPGASQLGGTVTTAPDPATKTATFKDLYLFGGTPDKAYTLVATSPGDDPSTSAPFVVKDGPTNLYVATTVPTTRAGDNLGPITVQVLDSNGTLSRGDDTGTITLFVDRNASDDPDGAKFLLTKGKEVVKVDSQTATVTNGVATFPEVRLMKAGVGFTLTAEATDNDIIKKATSNRFLITAGAAKMLDFQNPPTLAILNQPINIGGRTPPFAATGVTVQVQDQFGNPVLDSTATVKIALKDNPAGGSLIGAPPDGVAAVNGLATFTGLIINKAGDGYKLEANATGLDAKVTDAFRVLPGPGNPTLHFLNATGNPTNNPIGAGPFQVGTRLPTIVVDADGADGQQVTLGPQGRLFGETIVTAAFDPALGKTVAKFNNVFIGPGKTGEQLTLQAQFLTLGGLIEANPKFTLAAGQATKLLIANGGQIADGVAGTPVLLKSGGAIQVFIQDAYGNTVTDGPASTAAVWLGVNRARPNSLTTPIGDHDDPTGKSFGTYVKVNAVAGVATFPNIFINLASTDYQLAVGSPDFAFNTDTSQPFNESIGAASQVAFLVQPDTQGVGAFQRITGKGNQVIVAVEDRVGNVVKGDSGRNITISLATNPDPTKAALVGRDALKDQDGIAIFDLMYLTDTNDTPIPGFQLQATAGPLGTSPALPPSSPSNPFPLNASPGGIGRTIPRPDFTVVTPPGNVGVNQPLAFSFKVSAPGQPDTIYDNKVNVLVQLLNADGTPATDVFIGKDKIKQPVNGVITFSNDLVVTKPGQYRIRAVLDVLPSNLPDGEIITPAPPADGFLVTVSPGPDLLASAPPLPGGTGAPTNVVNLDLASFTENFDYISAFPAYKFLPDGKPQPLSQQFQPPSLPLTDDNTPPMVQPNVTNATSGVPTSDPLFNQVPQSTKWWSSLMFPRTKTDPASGVPQDANGNQLFPMFPDPFATLVNSASTFAGLGLSYLTHPFVIPAGQFVANDPGLPDGRQPGNVQYLYSYGSTGNFSDQRLYQDFAIGLQGLTGAAANATVLSYSDTTVTLDWNHQLQATLGEGLPFVDFLTRNMTGNATMQLVAADPNRTTTVTAFDADGNPVTTGFGAVRLEIKYTVMDKAYPGAPKDLPLIPITVDNTYGLFLPSTVQWSLPAGSTTLTASLTPGDATKNYFSVAILPDKPANAPATFYTDAFKFYQARAYSFVTGSTTNFSYDEASGKVTTTFALQTTPLARGPGLLNNRPLQTLYPNQWLALYPDSSGVATDPNTTYTYQVARGTLKVWDGPAFATALQYRGSLPLVPPVPEDGTSHADLWNNYLLPYLVSVSSEPTFDGCLSTPSK
jgi:hypothetical protein